MQSDGSFRQDLLLVLHHASAWTEEQTGEECEEAIRVMEAHFKLVEFVRKVCDDGIAPEDQIRGAALLKEIDGE